jgi:GTPase SAR1 family protein
MEKEINVIILGDKGVGKTSIFNILKQGSSNEINFNNNNKSNDIERFNIKRKYEKKNMIISLNINDIKNIDNYKGNIPMQYIHNNNIILLVFCNIKTLNYIKEKYILYNEKINTNNIRYILIGNKSDEFGDKKDEIIKEGQKFGEEIDAHFITYSTQSKDNMDNVERFIITEAKELIDNIDKQSNNNIHNVILENNENENNGNCCNC